MITALILSKTLSLIGLGFIASEKVTRKKNPILWEVIFIIAVLECVFFVSALLEVALNN